MDILSLSRSKQVEHPGLSKFISLTFERINSVVSLQIENPGNFTETSIWGMFVPMYWVLWPQIPTMHRENRPLWTFRAISDVHFLFAGWMHRIDSPNPTTSWMSLDLLLSIWVVQIQMVDESMSCVVVLKNSQQRLLLEMAFWSERIVWCNSFSRSVSVGAELMKSATLTCSAMALWEMFRLCMNAWRLFV